MKKRNTIILLSAVVVVLIAGGLGFHAISENNKAPSADWKDSYSDVDSMIEASDLIITGKVVGSEPEQRVDIIFTREQIEVKKVYKGNKEKGDRIEVLQTGGEMNNIKTQPFLEAPLLDKNGNYLFFLEYTNEGHYLIKGGFQGVGKIMNSKVQFNKENSRIAEQFKDKGFDVIDRMLTESIG